MALTDMQARKALPSERDYKLADSGGLHLFVTKKGHKSWRLKYRFAGKEKRLLLGPYPEVTLARARELRDDAKRMLRESLDPAMEAHKRKIAAYAAAGATLEKYALLWHEAQRGRWSAVHVKKVEQALRRDVFPQLGRLPLAHIDGPMILKALRQVERRGAIDTAKRIRQHISAIFQFAMAEGVVRSDPASSISKALLPTPVGGRQPAVRTLGDARALLAAMDASTSEPATKLASRLLALTVVRPGIVRAAQWEEFENIEWNNPGASAPDATWRIPAAKMKLELDDKTDQAFEHVVPLPKAAIAVLRQIRRLSGTYPYLFGSRRSPRHPMSENTISYMYARNGYAGRHVPHGWRSTFSTIMNERAVAERRLEDRQIIDGMLAHKPTGISGSEMAYNRAIYWDRRKQIAGEWATLLMEGQVPAVELLIPQR
ncbi:tyrosine-type recombinase/integrase [Sphingomonas oligophenolica]|uniref:DUF4102 domain-containing protein n=1 Tax=Sphingomonas oligophenolica TaxID=301154 RepID=A0A502CB64_9SPHN|nr:integrase arm-type DNA-binding domain-containing protein [Sphingomonas oligophenolica]TPG09982.1 DUF4102 domain-containing protein [Sphingomonas oligophenolica]